MTLALAIVGTVSGLIALAATLRREFLDRPRLRVAAEPLVRPDGTATVVGIVDNDGRRAVTIRGIGFVFHTSDRPPIGLNQQEILWTDPYQRRRVESEGHTEVAWDVTIKPYTHLDVPGRAFVEVGQGRRIYSAPHTLYRTLYKAGWNPPLGTDPAYLEPTSTALIAPPVVARWKLWHPAHARKAARVDEAFPGTSREEIAERLADAMRADEAHTGT